MMVRKRRRMIVVVVVVRWGYDERVSKDKKRDERMYGWLSENVCKKDKRKGDYMRLVKDVSMG